jgi:polysaccharide export outer membrane protein
MLLGKRAAVCLSSIFGGFAILALALPSAYAQTAMETQQQANDRIRSLSANTATPPHDYLIGRGDLVSVEVYDVPELTREVRVSQTGTIGMPLVPVRMYVAGLTEMQLQQKIAEVLAADGLVSHPQVMVAVKEKKSKPITIVGAVGHPMVYQADRPVTLIQVLAEAGGISPDAGDTVIITRGDSSDTGASNEPPEIGNDDAMAAPGPASPPSTSPPPVAQQKSETPEAQVAPAEPSTPSTAQQPVPQATSPTPAAPPPITAADRAPLPNTITVNLSELLERGDTQNNIPLQGGDVVTVPHAGIVYALGAVQRPGGFVSSNDRAQLSTLKLLALAGGMTRIAKKDRAVIIRKDAMGNQQSIPVDLAKIVNQKSEDVRLRPSDILYIPDNVTKAALIRAGEIALGIGTSIAIYRIGTK